MKLQPKKILIQLALTLGLLLGLEITASIIISKIYNRKFDSSILVKNLYGTSSGLKANIGKVIWGKLFTTDMEGHRFNRPRKVTAAKKKITLGDSVTQGVGVGDAETFSSLINQQDSTTKVSNISMIGWNTTDYKNVIQTCFVTQWDSLHEDTIPKSVQLFYCLNDIYSSAPNDSTKPIGMGGTAGKINSFLQAHVATYKLIMLLVHQNSDTYFQYDNALYKNNEKVQNAVEDLVAIKHILDARKVKFEVVLLPYRSQLSAELVANSPQRILAYHLGMNNISFIDLLPKMKNIENPKSLYLFGDEIHFSPKGHAAIAELLKPAA